MEGRAQEGMGGHGRKGKRGRTGAPFNFLHRGAADVVTPLWHNFVTVGDN